MDDALPEIGGADTRTWVLAGVNGDLVGSVSHETEALSVVLTFGSNEDMRNVIEWLQTSPRLPGEERTFLVMTMTWTLYVSEAALDGLIDDPRYRVERR